MPRLSWVRWIHGKDSRWSTERSSERSGRAKALSERSNGMSPSWFQRTRILILCFLRQRHVPSAIKKTADLKRTMLDARKAKEENRRRHTREGESKPKAERKSRCSLLGQYASTLLTSMFFGEFQEAMVAEQR